MTTAQECRQHAEHCEKMASKSTDDADRRMLQGAAAQWRKLALETDDHIQAMAAFRRSASVQSRATGRSSSQPSSWERLALLDEKTVIPTALTDHPCRHLAGFSFLGGRIKSHRALAAVTRAVAEALSDPGLREMVLRDAEMWERMAAFEE